MRKVLLKTFGCKVNQYDTQGLREKFLGAGYVETADEREADLIVINTCTVTAEADRKGRVWIRRIHRVNPTARIAVTGCYATAKPEEVAALPGVSYVVPNAEKHRLVETVRLEYGGRFCGEGDESDKNRYQELPISYFADRTRAYLKIQDGCNHACTYCKVVQVRGPAASRSLDEIVREGRRIAERGYEEVILTGVQLGAYGDEWKGNPGLVDVLETLAEISGIARIRLSSIDPSDVTERLVHLMEKEPKLCPHLHLPLQSGDDEILKRMKRAYRARPYARLVEELRARVTDFCLTTDVMVGFPGEEEGHFQRTLEVLRETVPLKIHIFPFSPREGTPAAQFKDTVKSTVQRERVKRLEQCAAVLARRYQEQFLGREMQVIGEERKEGCLEGRTMNYLRVSYPAEASLLKQRVNVKLCRIGPACLLGELITN
jgi:threonylcarbamoyladenosine tRNA methylthiotransferase MtaB